MNDPHLSRSHSNFDLERCFDPQKFARSAVTSRPDSRLTLFHTSPAALTPKMATQIHRQPVILSATQGLHSQPQKSASAPGHINKSWSDYSSSPAEAHANVYWGPPVFPGDNHTEAPRSDIYTKPSRELQVVGDLLPIKYEPSTPMGLDAPGPSRAGSSSSVESDSFPAGSRKYKSKQHHLCPPYFIA